MGLQTFSTSATRTRSCFLRPQGKHEFFLEEVGQIRDVREAPIKLYGYAISERDGHPHVRIEQRVPRAEELLGGHRGAPFEGVSGARTWTLPFEPYAPVRAQLHCVLREINRRRKVAGSSFSLLLHPGSTADRATLCGIADRQAGRSLAAYDTAARTWSSLGPVCKGATRSAFSGTANSLNSSGREMSASLMIGLSSSPISI